jgi:hypothetical protein
MPEMMSHAFVTPLIRNFLSDCGEDIAGMMVLLRQTAFNSTIPFSQVFGENLSLHREKKSWYR